MEAGLRIGLVLVSILVAGLSADAQQPGAQVPEPGEQAFVDWARQNAIPLKTVEAGYGFEGMAPVGKIVGDARIVELGEATHGTHEF